MAPNTIPQPPAKVQSLYYESHITIDPVFEDRLMHLRRVAEEHGFRVATLLMQKRPTDTPELSRFDTFMTASSQSYAYVATRTAAAVIALRVAGYVVRRYKIEDCIIDSRTADTFGVLAK